METCLILSAELSTYKDKNNTERNILTITTTSEKDVKYVEWNPVWMSYPMLEQASEHDNKKLNDIKRYCEYYKGTYPNSHNT
jgi:hypothetical protein